MKHPYRDTCDCTRCHKERERRTAQATADPRRLQQVARKRRARKPITRRPVPGSQEWAETRGDDIPSYDVPGDDFDMD